MTNLVTQNNRNVSSQSQRPEAQNQYCWVGIKVSVSRAVLPPEALGEDPSPPPPAPGGHWHFTLVCGGITPVFGPGLLVCVRGGGGKRNLPQLLCHRDTRYCI